MPARALTSGTRADLRLSLQPQLVHCAGYDNARVHSGFARSLNSSGLYQELEAELAELLQKQPVAAVHFIGHSLGAAMAAIAAPLMKAQLQLHDVRLWTFGCPRVGNMVCLLVPRPRAPVAAMQTGGVCMFAAMCCTVYG